MTLKGIDISAWQSTVPPLTGLSFVFAKATEGTGYTSPQYAHQAAAVKAAGLVLGAYHYGDRSPGAAQAAHFLTVCGRDTHLVALDLEGATETTASDAAAFIRACKAAGKTVGVYHSLSSFPHSLGQDFDWVALWGSAPPPAPWAFWQQSGTGVDRDVFSGDLAALRRLAQIAVPVPVPGPAPVAHTLHIAHGAQVGYPVVTEPSPGVFRAGKPVTILTWTGPDTALPCSAPYHDAVGKTTLVHVAKGLPHTWVHAVGPGISVTHS